MKYYRRIILISFLLSLFIISVSYAHPGKTDANGGHYDSSTGEYHYHHGYPAHQHPDGICPYSYNLNNSNPTFDTKEKEDMYNRIIENHEEYLESSKNKNTSEHKQEIVKDEETKKYKHYILDWIFEHDSLIFFIIFITIDAIVLLIDKLKRN